MNEAQPATRSADAIDVIDVVMVGVDPKRDNEVLDQYVTTFISDAVAAGSDDAELLAAGVERIYTPKDFDLTRIMGDIVDIVGEAAR